MPWLRAQRCFIGHVEARAIAVSFSGEQAVELHIANTQLYAAYKTLIGAGEAFGLTHFGIYAIDSMRMERGYGQWKADFITEFKPYEAALDRFVDAAVTTLCSFDLDNALPRGCRGRESGC